jgi:hypothetical protein
VVAALAVRSTGDERLLDPDAPPLPPREPPDAALGPVEAPLGDELPAREPDAVLPVRLALALAEALLEQVGGSCRRSARSR